MSKEIYRTIRVSKDIQLQVNVKECLEDVLALIDGCSYGDLFTSMSQKISAWSYWKEYQQKVTGTIICPPCLNRETEDINFLYALIYFFYNASIDSEFIKYCANKEGENPVAYVLGLLS